MAFSLQLDQTLLGRPGVPYHLKEVFYERKRPKGIIDRFWLALSNSETYVVKPVSPFLYDQAFKLQKGISFSPFIADQTDPEGCRAIDRVAIADTEDAAKVKKDESIFAQVVNILWRSLEAQIGIRVGKASNI
ncbi:MAG: hypothetical protein M1834_005432 [Cirrosporium novae-zelandiae]|nr:MAG: hypothetical protein M1834_005432 [Cirrosporium novae-zelandiae]